MRRNDFHFDLPPSLIAQHPPAQRSHSRLLCLDGKTGCLQDQLFTDLPQHLTAGDLLVFNDTQVMKARMLGHKQSGGKVEVLVERLLDDQRALAYVRASKAPLEGSRLLLSSALSNTGKPVMVKVLGRTDNLFELYFDDARPLLQILDDIGQVPLPPYITRCPATEDEHRYQTVYARNKGAVAAPTAGLHFDQALLELLQSQGIESAFITLHVGAGTFDPMRGDIVEDHKMHRERVTVSKFTCEQIHNTRARGGRVIAVGTTTARALEGAAHTGTLEPFCDETAIFIYPGFRFNTIDALITNFHLSESTLLMMVCAFAGQENVLAAYRHAVAHEYRFFSYGDAMFVLPHEQAINEK